MAVYEIENPVLCGEAFNCAIKNVAHVLNETLGTKYFYSRDWATLELLADNLGIRFNIDGEIVSNSILYLDNRTIKTKEQTT